MQRSISLLCGCFAWMWALPVVAQQPVPAEPEIELPSWDDPPVAAAKRPRDRTSDALIATGGAVLSLGITLQMVGFASWYRDSRLDYHIRIEPNLIPFVEIGCGVILATIGSTFFGVGAKRHGRWKAGLLDESARVQLQPVVGFGQLGVVGRF